MATGVGNLPLCMENRMLAADATGVATYARALREAQRAISGRALLLGGGRASAFGAAQTRVDRWRRSLRSLVPVGVRARHTADGFARHDLFRLGHVFFTVHGRLLPVRVPGPPGIMHWSYPVPLRLAGWHNVYTVHDAIPLTHPELSPIDPGRHRRLLAQVAAWADAIVTVSQSAAAEIVAAVDVPFRRVIDCSQPATARDQPDQPLPAGLEARRYLLVCGSVEPRKNVERIAAAYRASGAALPLVIAGPDGWRSAEAAAMLGRTPGVVRLPYQNRASMVALIARARALLMPSLAEGFGLPVAEAMALGTPVITSAAGALAETADDAALLVDPLDTDAIAAAIARIVHDDVLCRALAVAGRERARRFDAGSFADRLGAAYDRLKSDPTP